MFQSTEKIKTVFVGSPDNQDNIAGFLGFVSYVNGSLVADIKANELSDLRASFYDKLRDCLIIIEDKKLKSPQMISWAYIRNDQFIIDKLLKRLEEFGRDNEISRFLDNLRKYKLVKVENRDILEQLIHSPLLKEYDRKTFSKIYKWIGFEKDFEEKIDTICESKIYCSMPTKVNDLLDCQIAIADCDWTKFLSKLTTDSKDIEFNMNRGKLILNNFSRLVQFYSCSRQPYDNIATTNMWGQYADHGNGICLEYDINDLFITHMSTDKDSLVVSSYIENTLHSSRIKDSNRHNINGQDVNHQYAKKMLYESFERERKKLYPHHSQDKQAKYFCANEIAYLDPRELIQKRSDLFFTYLKQILKREPQRDYQTLRDFFENYFRYKTLNWQHEEEVRFSVFPYMADTLLKKCSEVDKTLLANRNYEQAKIEFDSIFQEYEDNEENKEHNFIKPSTIVFGHKVKQSKINDVKNKINDPKIRYLKITGAIMTNEAKLEVHPLNQL